MPTGYFKSGGGPLSDVFIDAFAYIENVGGEGPNGEVLLQDSFIPLRYGCTLAESQANGRLCSTTGLGVRSKLMYQQLYGTVQNRVDPFEPVAHTGKTMLRIYGDVLYTTAVAYGAGLIQRFLDEVTQPPLLAGRTRARRASRYYSTPAARPIRTARLPPTRGTSPTTAPSTCRRHPRRHSAGDHQRHRHPGQPMAGESPDATGHHRRVGRRRVR